MSKGTFRKRFEASIIKPDASDDEVSKFVERCKRYSDELAAIAFNLH